MLSPRDAFLTFTHGMTEHPGQSGGSSQSGGSGEFGHPGGSGHNLHNLHCAKFSVLSSAPLDGFSVLLKFIWATSTWVQQQKDP